tara:strand:+ start:590 stop:1390 length:801 start_codon:yes stop_codon:yes gene_type:complete
MTKIIAEIGWNHMGDMNLAKEMIKAAKESGADFAKFQTWSVDRLKPGPWNEDGRIEIYKKAELTRENHEELISYCKEVEIEFMSSVFSIADAQLLVDLGIKTVKIPSMECRNIELVKFCNEHFESIYMSTGATTLKEVCNSVDLIDKPLFLMHCVSSYPCSIEDANLNKIFGLKGICPTVGYSDHCLGTDVAKFAMEYGINVIEKHFTTDTSLPGRDNQFAITPPELKSLKAWIDNKAIAQQYVARDYLPVEEEVRNIYHGRFNNE